MVLLDSPALIPVSDSMEIASRVDSVLLTIHVQNNSGDSALRARDLLSSVGANVLGVVANDPALQRRQESSQPDRSRIEFWKAGRPWPKPRTGYYADADADTRSPQPSV
jgi:Mrp family chromosome partitioning ATPase